MYAVGFLLFIGAWGANSSLQYVFFPILIETQVRVVRAFPRHNLGMPCSNHGGIQVIAPSLIVLRVAKQRALTRHSTVSGGIGTIRFKSQVESTTTDGDGIPPSGDTLASMGADIDAPGERGVEVETVVDEVSI